MTASRSPQHQPLRPELAFVVQLAAADPAGPMEGRVEHVASGQAQRFASAVELLEFLGTAGPGREPAPKP